MINAIFFYPFTILYNIDQFIKRIVMLLTGEIGLKEYFSDMGI